MLPFQINIITIVVDIIGVVIVIIWYYCC